MRQLEKRSFAVIVDADDREALRHYIARVLLIENLDDNTEVEKDSVISAPETSEQVVIAEWDPYANPTIAEKSTLYLLKIYNSRSYSFWAIWWINRYF